jgi:hypothetical protein
MTQQKACDRKSAITDTV